MSLCCGSILSLVQFLFSFVLTFFLLIIVHYYTQKQENNASVNPSCAHPPPRETAGHLHALSVPGVGH